MAWRDEELRRLMQNYISEVKRTLGDQDPKVTDHILTVLQNAFNDLAPRAERMISDVAAADDSPRKIKAVRVELARANRDMRNLLREYLRFIRLRLAEIRAESASHRIGRYVLDSTSRIDAMRSSGFYERLGISPPRPLVFDKGIHIALWQVAQDKLKAARRLAYSTLWSATRRYWSWAWRYVKQVVTSNVIEFLIVFGLLGQGVGAVVGVIERESLIWGVLGGALIEIVNRYLVGPWLDERFMKRKKEALAISIRDFHLEALKTQGFLALADTLREGFLDSSIDNAESELPSDSVRPDPTARCDAEPA
ncbi:MAG: hypothetical protein AB7F35_26415 [Acetobacteraceae bacterium]